MYPCLQTRKDIVLVASPTQAISQSFLCDTINKALVANDVVTEPFWMVKQKAKRLRPKKR